MHRAVKELITVHMTVKLISTGNLKLFDITAIQDAPTDVGTPRRKQGWAKLACLKSQDIKFKLQTTLDLTNSYDKFKDFLKTILGLTKF